MTATNSITVFLLDDHDLVRHSIAQLLEAEPDIRVVGESATAAGALPIVESTHPRVAVLDIRLRDGNGIDVCRSIRTSHPDVRCLILTSFSDDRAIVDAARAGADGVIVKQIRGNAIVRSIRDVASGKVLLDQATVATSMERLREAERGSISALAEHETRLFELIGHGRTNTQIASLTSQSITSVRSEVADLLRKLGMVRRIEANEAFDRAKNAWPSDSPQETFSPTRRVPAPRGWRVPRGS